MYFENLKSLVMILATQLKLNSLVFKLRQAYLPCYTDI